MSSEVREVLVLFVKSSLKHLPFLPPSPHYSIKASSCSYHLIFYRYRNELQRNTYAMTNMKIVLRHDKDILSRYQLALELEYHDEVESIIKSEAGALVRDTSSLS